MSGTQNVEMTDRLDPKGNNNNLSSLRTAGVDIDDSAQPFMPTTHRRLANPAPLGLISFGTVIFLISCFGVNARDVMVPNIILGVTVFFGGVCLLLCGIIEMVAGNTLGATIFPTYAAFNLAYAMIFIPGTGILAAYTDKATGQLIPEFSQALAIWFWAWFIVTCILTVAVLRTTWPLLGAFSVFSVELILLATGYMTENPHCLTAANSLGFIVAFFGYWAGTASLWTDGITPFTLPAFPLYSEK